MIHCDIKPAHVFLNWKHDTNHGPYSDVQLGDFGLAMALPPLQTFIDTDRFQGTAPYAAPEQLNACQYSLVTDIWGFRTVLHQMIHFIPPIQEMMVKTRKQQKEFEEALKNDNEREAEEATVKGLER